MIQYRYMAITATGKKRRGTLSAESPRAARAQLCEQQLTLISLKPDTGTSAHRQRLRYPGGVPRTIFVVATWCYSLANYQHWLQRRYR